MTHLAIDIRLMAFKFFDLAVEYHPPSFFSYAEKVSSFVHDIQMFGVHFFIIGVWEPTCFVFVLPFVCSWWLVQCE